jgi:hypothetical protein
MNIKALFSRVIRYLLEPFQVKWTEHKDAQRKKDIFLNTRYGTHNLKCPNCGRRLHKVERKLWFSWLTVRRETSCIEMHYDPTYAPITLLCRCAVCAAVFGKPPIVEHDNWKVNLPYQGKK